MMDDICDKVKECCENLEKRVGNNEKLLNTIINGDVYQEMRGVNTFFYNNNAPIYIISKLDQLKQDGIEFIFFCPYLYLKTATDSTFTVKVDDNIFKQVIDEAVTKGFQIGLKPHILIEDTSDGNQVNPKDLDAFFGNYLSIILKYLSFNDFYMVSVANEVPSITSTHESYWNNLIDTIRNLYSEIIIMNSNTRYEVLTTVFMNKLDLTGLNLYPALSKEPLPTTEELIDGWFCNFDNSRDIDFVNEIYQKYNKKVLITETGCLPYLGATENTGLWEHTGVYNEEIQARFYESAFELLFKMENVDGIVFWAANDGYTFLDREAEQVIKNWWGGSKNG